jgi:hypothetical protein
MRPKFGDRRASEVLAAVAERPTLATEMLSLPPWARPAPWGKWTDDEIEAAIAAVARTKQ